MQKIKVAFAALTAIAGIGGAYATTQQGATERVGTLYKWVTVTHQLVTVYQSLTIGQAKLASGCTAGTVRCLHGTALQAGKPAVTIFRR